MNKKSYFSLIISLLYSQIKDFQFVFSLNAQREKEKLFDADRSWKTSHVYLLKRRKRSIVKYSAYFFVIKYLIDWKEFVLCRYRVSRYFFFVPSRCLEVAFCVGFCSSSDQPLAWIRQKECKKLFGKLFRSKFKRKIKLFLYFSQIYVRSVDDWNWKNDRDVVNENNYFLFLNKLTFGTNEFGKIFFIKIIFKTFDSMHRFKVSMDSVLIEVLIEIAANL